MKKPEFIVKNANYEGCTAEFSEARIVVVGAGYDGTSSYRPGSRFAPTALRSETVLAQENYSPYFERDLTEIPVHDLGDVDIPFGEKEAALQRIEGVSRFIVAEGKVPFFIGGEHLITLAAIKPLLKKYENLQVVQLDAHLDLMDELFGERLSHGTVMRRVYDLLPPEGRIFQVGVRSGSREEYRFARSRTRLFPFRISEFLEQISQLDGKPVYLTVDLDVFDPSLIPGTGTPEAGGIFFPEFIEFLRAMQGMNIVGADMVELAPHIDPTHVSTITASKVLREMLIVI